MFRVELALLAVLASIVVPLRAPGQQSRAATSELPLRDSILRSRLDPNATPGVGSDSTANAPAVVLDEQPSHGRVALVTGTLLGSMAAIHLYQQNGWWRDNRRSFHVQEDLVYGVNVDKIGHFYGSVLSAFVISRAYQWANVSERTSIWLGATGGLLFQTYVEIEDGFSEWGFDRIDFAADLAGAGWAVARHYAPGLQTIDLKMSYHPSGLLGNPGGVGFKGQQHLVIDDYEGQTFWLSVKVNDILPRSAQEFWPDFLCLSVGYAARDVANDHPYRVYLIAPDLDMTNIIPPSSPFLKTLGEALNFIHLPLPAIQLWPTTIWYGIYF